MSKKILYAFCGLSCLSCVASELTLNHELYNEAINEIHSESFEGKAKPAAELAGKKKSILPEISSSFNVASLDVSPHDLAGDVAVWQALTERMRDSSTLNLVPAAQARMDIVTLFRALNKGIDDVSLGLVLKLHDDYLLGKKAARLEVGLALLQGLHQQIIWPQSQELAMAIFDSLKKDLRNTH